MGVEGEKGRTCKRRIKNRRKRTDRREGTESRGERVSMYVRERGERRERENTSARMGETSKV